MTKPSSSAPRAKSGDRRAAIIAAATRTLNEEGLEGFSMAAAARHAGLHPTSLSYYFESKEALVAACFETTLDRLAALVDGVTVAPSLDARLTDLVTRFFEMLALAARGEDAPIASLTEIRVAGAPEAYARLLSIVSGAEDAFAHGVLEHDAARRTAVVQHVMHQMLWAPHWLHLYQPSAYPRVAARLSDLLAHGMAAPGEQWSLTAPPPPATNAASREAFLIAATEMVNERGFRSTSIEEIAARLHLTKGSFYHHYHEKAALIAACFDRTLDAYDVDLTAAEEAGGSGWTQLRAATSALVARQLDPDTQLLRAFAINALPAPMRAAVSDRYAIAAQRFAAMIADGVADGSMRAVDPAIAARYVLIAINASAYAPAPAEGEDRAALIARHVALGAFTGLLT